MEVAEGLEWVRVYWLRGEYPKNWRGRIQHIPAVKDPPCSGWQHAYILRGEKRSTIFCPYSFDSFNVKNNCAEVAGAEEPKGWDIDRAKDLLERNWRDMQARGWQKDYDTATVVFRKLGFEVPQQTMRGGEMDTRKKGGKETADELKKPVKRNSKRGKFLQWYLEGDCSRSIRETMVEFDMTRSNALSYLFMLQKDHGIGYELIGDQATITLPGDCTDPFGDGKSVEVKPKDNGQEEDDSWLESPEPGATVNTKNVAEDDDSWLD